MRILVTGSAGHLGEAIMRTLARIDHDVLGIDILASPFTHGVGSIVDRDFVERSMAGIDAVIHTATLHKPHTATHSRQDFVDTNITGTLNQLEEARLVGVLRTDGSLHNPSLRRRRFPECDYLNGGGTATYLVSKHSVIFSASMYY